jgi:hypothetical protein
VSRRLQPDRALDNRAVAWNARQPFLPRCGGAAPTKARWRCPRLAAPPSREELLSSAEAPGSCAPFGRLSLARASVPQHSGIVAPFQRVASAEVEPNGLIVFPRAIAVDSCVSEYDQTAKHGEAAEGNGVWFTPETGQVTLARLEKALEAWNGFLGEIGRRVAGVSGREAVRYVITEAKGGSLTLGVRPQPARKEIPPAVMPRIAKTVTTGIRSLERSTATPRGRSIVRRAAASRSRSSTTSATR